MMYSNLNFSCFLLSLAFLFLSTAVFGPDGASSCVTSSLDIILLNEAEGVIVGDNVVLVCRHTFETRVGSPCIFKWNWTPKDEYLEVNFTSELAPTTTDRHILIIPNVRKNDSQIISCSISSTSPKSSPEFNLTVYDPLPPKIVNKSNNSIKHQLEYPILVGATQYKIDCYAVGHPKPNISWFKVSNGLPNSKPVTEYCLGQPDVDLCLSGNLTTLTIRNLDKKSEGKYNCTAESRTGIDYASTWIITRNATSVVNDTIKPEILDDSNITESTPFTYRITNATNITDLKLYLTCYIAGWPIPNVTWTRKNDEGEEVITDSKLPGVQVIDQNELVFSNVSLSLSDYEYGCRDQRGLISPMFRKFKITNSSSAERFLGANAVTETIMIIWAFIFIGLIITSAFIIVFSNKSKDSDFMEELIQEFHKGRQENFNSDLEVKEAAECRPYDTEYEFPRSNLKLGKRLGSGAFGLVMFGEANGIVRKGLVTPVAVKMVKNNYEIAQIRALTSEIKIMQTIGKHLNIVNLLGACTDNLKNLLVITEYCSYGNLHEFLLQNRNIFVSQVDSDTGIYTGKNIKSTILQEMMSVTYVESESFANFRKSLLKIDNTDDSNNTTNNDYDDVASFTEDFSLEKAADGKSELLYGFKDMPKPETVSNHYEINLNVSSKVKFDKTADISKICTDDLFCWAYQIARGMEYLSSRKIIHGDLAIRNVLLANHNIVKISDFGLSKDVYHYADQNYVKKSKQALPVKWMALESIADRVFSTQSDVWTYGIVLWELFSLAETPYAGMDDFQRLFHKLKLGYRMERPVNATADIYNLMLECWNREPRARPNFNKIGRIVSDMLERTLKDYYLGLMEYIEENPSKIYDDDYQVMCYVKRNHPQEETHPNTDGPTLELLTVDERATTPGYLDMHGNS